ncbi:3-oxoacyl-[acyl-carrier-protein] synthase III C-terminal domain-containing protein [Actinacidiphila guanduensis]|uniref:3-oxoacyl-[acyl-carrier-protein] synthase-3 n=1 Tax=Actinacidiphila guanduensis TaxID=310781 RepID=A0A1H0BPD0_9ACTN|nr:3-oxoacyl-[acyl-carrier-protein] synthase III C-terminal domain-containing protein [Actinacidiphila guanduensis]SDN47507.1 3-oxoacyl-[acyl-carrier-protein] synthase-3 [Actinacidiphila guanduensis]
MLYLRRVVPRIPAHSVAIADLGQALEVPDSEIRLLTRFLGLDRIVTAEGRSTLDMLLALGHDALAGADRAKVRHLVHAHTVQHLAPPALRWMDVLRDKLGLHEASAFSLSHQGCVIGLSALKTAESLLTGEPAGSQALLLIGEKALSPVMQHIPGTSVLGDATAAVLADLEGPGDAVLSVAHRTLGEFHQARHMSPELQHRYRQQYTPTLAAVMLEAVAAAGLDLDAIDLVLPHNVNRYSWTTTARRLGLPPERIYLDNVPRTGHCFCADSFMNLATARAEQALPPGRTALMVSAGQGGTFAAAAVRTATGRE